MYCVYREKVRIMTRKSGVSGGATARHSGFTLLEVMIASTVLMLLIAGFVGSFIMALRTLDAANNQYRAKAIARNRIQRARSFEFSSLSLLAEEDSRIDRYGNIDQDGDYRRTTMISTNTPTWPHTIRIQVEVRYPLRSRAGHVLAAPLIFDNLIARQM